MKTYSQALADARHRLHAIHAASLDAQLLLCEATGENRAAILAHPERLLSDIQAEYFAQMVQRRAQGEPLAYIRGRMPFYDREFIVTPDVLIPRPETELLLEWALDVAQQTHPRVVVDIGTGSGALALTFKAHYPDATVYGVDISAAALGVAQRNSAAHAVTVDFLHGDLLEPLAARGIQPDMVLANLPYIDSADVPQLEVSRYEPTLALDGGADGLALIRRMLARAPQVCTAGAWLFLEIGAAQGQAALALAQQVGEAELRQDYAGLDRLLCVRLNKDL